MTARRPARARYRAIRRLIPRLADKDSCDGTLSASLVVSQFENDGVDRRFLLADDKKRIVGDWENIKGKDVLGRGGPDREVVPWCDKINGLPGLCTLQSCAGHKDGDTLVSGHLWLLMSQSMADRFDRAAFLLLRNEDLIEQISWLYLHEGKKIASIIFAGNERESLEMSISLIYGFLCGVADVSD